MAAAGRGGGADGDRGIAISDMMVRWFFCVTRAKSVIVLSIGRGPARRKSTADDCEDGAGEAGKDAT
jgi:hypothetical protein